MRPLSAAPPEIEGQFLGVECPLDSARFAVLPLPFERTTSYKKGTKNGPRMLIEGSMGVELWDEELSRQTYRAGIHTLPPMDFPGEEDARAAFPRVSRKVSELLARKDRILFSIGGEHSLTQAILPPFLDKYPGLSVLHFDAHADLRPEYEGTPHNHACALYPASRRARLVQVGIRSVAEEEAHLVNAGNVTTFLRHEHPDARRLIPKVLRALSGPVYLTIDLDGFDPAVIPGVGTPQPGGFSWQEGLDLFRAVIEKRDVVGVDVMELCPLKDTVASELAAAKLIYRLMGYLSLKNQKSSRANGRR